MILTPRSHRDVPVEFLPALFKNTPRNSREAVASRSLHGGLTEFQEEFMKWTQRKQHGVEDTQGLHGRHQSSRIAKASSCPYLERLPLTSVLQKGWKQPRVRSKARSTGRARVSSDGDVDTAPQSPGQLDSVHHGDNTQAPLPELSQRDSRARNRPNFFKVDKDPERELRFQDSFVAIRAVTILPDGSTGKAVATVSLSPSDKLSSLRAPIQAEMDPDSQNNQPFVFSYADGVAINRSHEEGLRIKQVATQSLLSKANRLRPPSDKKKRLLTVFLRVAGDGQGEGKALKRIGGSSSTNESFVCGTTSESPSFEISENQRSPAPVRWRTSHAGAKARGNSRSCSKSPTRSRRRVRKQVELLREASETRIAKVVKGDQTRVRFREYLGRHHRATKIQFCSQRRAARLEHERCRRRRYSAIKIQSAARSWAARREAHLRRQRREAATRVQCCYRSALARRELRSRFKEKEAAVSLQCWARSQAAKAEMTKRRVENRSAVVIECMARKSAARSKVSHMRKERTSAIRIQSQVRARAARKEAQKRVERNRAAENIQRLARGRAVRLESTTRRKRRDAARQIQMAVRQRAARKMVGKKRKERDVAQRRKEEDKAAARIQAGVRGSRARKRIQETNKRRDIAATKIGSAVRRRQKRRRAENKGKEITGGSDMQKQQTRGSQVEPVCDATAPSRTKNSAPTEDDVSSVDDSKVEMEIPKVDARKHKCFGWHW